MGLNDTPSGERLHIGFFGVRNAGKSSLVNAVTNQELSVVSDIKGTTTDPVYKSMELLPLGPVMIIDTPGFDDCGQLGELRIKKTKEILNRTDIAVLVTDASAGLTGTDRELISLFAAREIPYIIVYNKSDIAPKSDLKSNEISVSALDKTNINQLKELIGTLVKTESEKLKIVGDLIQPNDFVILVVPIDSAAPKGRLILPQQQTIRDILEAGAVPVVTRETELAETLRNTGKKPAMVITDSQAFGMVSKIVPEDIPLTSFSILMARYKGFLRDAVKGAAAIGKLRDGDKVLISEGCTHHRQCEDIGTVKLPKWLAEYTGAELQLEFTSGREFPEDLSGLSLVIHCGGCMLNEKEMKFRRKAAAAQNIPFTNYGTAIAFMKGILKRSTAIFPAIAAELE
ncbi:MAG: [FeFe] hydrogenase H-cluster maturation GTPase HydF [Ruminococcus sp.]|nr:[FeFe] hydrogenase H-cluster maturation GTPase HydF [Ruminococcus sp.]